MPTLDQLKRKWFIDFTATGVIPPSSRYTGSVISPSTDGNRVTFTVDGKDYMMRWHNLIDDMIHIADPSACEIWHGGWRFEGVPDLGRFYSEFGCTRPLQQCTGCRS